MSGEADPAAWYVVACVDCGKPLKVQGAPPEKPICRHCDIIRAAPESMRETIRKTLAPLPDDPIPDSDDSAPDSADAVGAA